jgi:hypothetical protein
MDLQSSPKPTTAKAIKKSEQIRLRIRLAVAAYSYEYYDDSIMSDAEYDRLSLLVDTSVSTGNRKMDTFFKKRFNPDTGQWVRFHPEKRGLGNIYHRYFKGDH